MLGLRFFNDDPPRSCIIRGEAFTFLADTIQRQPDGDTVARHIHDQWLVGSEFFLKIDCSEPVECLFVGAVSQRRGPYQKVTVMDGVLTADGRALAMLSETNGWGSLVGSEMWSKWDLVDASSPRTAE
jgi:hypothetical protein